MARRYCAIDSEPCGPPAIGRFMGKGRLGTRHFFQATIDGRLPLRGKYSLIGTVMAASEFSPEQLDRIIQMAWEDRTSFEAIRTQFGLSPGDVIKLMRSKMTSGSFKLWRKRTSGRITKHDNRFSIVADSDELRRFRAKGQRG